MTDQITDNLKRIHHLWRHGRDEWAEWRGTAQEARRFTRGRQWTESQLAANNETGRHSLTINITTRLARALSGAQRQNRRDIKAEKRKGGNAAVASILTALSKHTMQLRNDQGQRAISECFDHGVRACKGFITYEVTHDDDPFSGDLCITSPHPMLVTEDPDSVEYDLSDAKFVDLAKWISKRAINAKYKSKMGDLAGKMEGDEQADALIASLTEDITMADEYSEYEDDDDDNVDRSRYQYLVHSTYCRVPVRRVSLLVKRTMEVVSFDPGDTQSRREAAGRVFELAGDMLSAIPDDVIGKERGRLVRVAEWLATNAGDQFDYADRWTYRVDRTVWLGSIELEYERDYTRGRNRLPVFRFCPYFDGGKVMGVIEQLIDPQRELNKRRSQLLNILNQTANSGWIIEQASEKNRNMLAKYGSAPQVLQKSDFGGTIEKVEPNRLPDGFLTISDRSFSDTEYITGMNSAVLGQDTGTNESGVAQDQRRRSGMTVLEPIFDNLDWTIGQFAESLVETIRTSGIYSEEEILALVDESDLIDPQVLAQAEAELMPDIEAMLAEAGQSVPQPLGVSDTALMIPEHQQVAMAVADEQQQAFHDAIDPMVRERAIELTMELLKAWKTGRYGVVVTESPEAPTERFANREELRSLVDAGVPVPPDVLVDTTGLPRDVKDRIKQYQAQQAQAQEPAAMAGAA